MGQRKEETTQESRTTTDLAPRTEQEQQMLDLLANAATQAGGALDVGAIGKLLSGEGLMPTESDRALVEESFGATEDLATRALESFVRQGNLGLDETLSSRGIQGSSIEAVQRAVVNRDAQQQLANILDKTRGESAQALMGLPFQRAGVQLNANQALFNQLLGGATNAATFGLNERIADIDTSGYGKSTTVTTPGFVDYVNAGANLAKSIRGGG